MNFNLEFLDPKVIDQRLISRKSQKPLTCDERLWKAAYFRDQIAKYRNAKDQGNGSGYPNHQWKTIEHIIEQKTNIPVGDLKEKNSLNWSPSRWPQGSSVIGRVVDKIAKAIRRNRVGLGKHQTVHW